MFVSYILRDCEGDLSEWVLIGEYLGLCAVVGWLWIDDRRKHFG